MNSKIIIATPGDLKGFIFKPEIDLNNPIHLKAIKDLIWQTMKFFTNFETKEDICNEIDFVLETSKTTYQNRPPRFGILCLED